MWPRQRCRAATENGRRQHQAIIADLKSEMVEPLSRAERARVTHLRGLAARRLGGV